MGPDLTIWIKDCEREEMQRTGGGVEVREADRALCVRKESGEEVEGRALRRLVFVVGEAVRGVAGRRIS